MNQQATVNSVQDVFISNSAPEVRPCDHACSAGLSSHVDFLYDRAMLFSRSAVYSTPRASRSVPARSWPPLAERQFGHMLRVNITPAAGARGMGRLSACPPPRWERFAVAMVLAKPDPDKQSIFKQTHTATEPCVSQRPAPSDLDLVPLGQTCVTSSGIPCDVSPAPRPGSGARARAGPHVRRL